MENQKNKKTSKEKYTLIAGLCISAVCVAGTTFAWMSSTDEVTNRLSAKGKYDVAVFEEFTPPTDWTPGQEIDKNVRAINTGNVDSWVKFGLSHQFTVTGYGTPIDVGTDGKVATADAEKLNNAITLGETAAKAEQAGGYVVVKAGKKVPDAEKKEVPSGTLLPDETVESNGLYIFRATITQTTNDDNTVESTYTYSGYYKETVVNGEKTTTTYYAIDIQKDFDPDAKENPYSKVKIKTKGDKKTAPSTEVTFVKADGNTTNKFTEATALKVVYNNGTGDKDETADDITVYVKFDAKAKEKYTYTQTKDDNNYYYCYNDVVMAGVEDANYLIDSVTLGTETKDGAYLELDYDLNIKLDSIQASMKEDGTYTNETASTWVANTKVTGKQKDKNGNTDWKTPAANSNEGKSPAA